jgi:hypothetical protein
MPVVVTGREFIVKLKHMCDMVVGLQGAVGKLTNSLIIGPYFKEATNTIGCRMRNLHPHNSFI